MTDVPSWQTDFRDAHERHWKDGERLYQAQRWANADHLYGLSAECGLKAVMVGLGMGTDDQGSPPKGYKVHVNKLWGQFLTFLQGRPQAQYAGLLSDMNPFENWSAEQRYAHQKHFTQDMVLAHREATDKVRSVVRRAREDGVVP